MVDQYTQTVEVKPSKRLQTMHFFGTVLLLITLGLVLVALFLSYYAFIAVGITLIGSIALSQSYSSSAKEYEYALNPVRIVISRQNQLGKRVRKLELLLADITAFAQFCDLLNSDDLIFCDNVQESGVYAVTFNADNVEHRMLFCPDEYFVALVKESLPHLFVNTQPSDGDL